MVSNHTPIDMDGEGGHTLLLYQKVSIACHYTWLHLLCTYGKMFIIVFKIIGLSFHDFLFAYTNIQQITN